MGFGFPQAGQVSLLTIRRAILLAFPMHAGIPATLYWPPPPGAAFLRGIPLDVGARRIVYSGSQGSEVRTGAGQRDRCARRGDPASPDDWTRSHGSILLCLPGSQPDGFPPKRAAPKGRPFSLTASRIAAMIQLTGRGQNRRSTGSPHPLRTLGAALFYALDSATEGDRLP